MADGMFRKIQEAPPLKHGRVRSARLAGCRAPYVCITIKVIISPRLAVTVPVCRRMRTDQERQLLLTGDCLGSLSMDLFT